VAYYTLPVLFARHVRYGVDARNVPQAVMLVHVSQAIIETKIMGVIPARWVAEHTIYEPPHLFEDVQISGPFKAWRHQHIIKEHPEGAVLRDEIEYVPPMSFLGALAAPIFIVPTIQKMFDYRHEVTRKWCEEVHAAT